MASRAPSCLPDGPPARSWRCMHLGHRLVAAGLAISGVYDLRPLRDTALNDPLKLSDEEIATLSPLRSPPTPKPLAIAYGTCELPALVHDSRELHALRSAAHAPGPLLPIAGADHFSILEELRRPGGAARPRGATPDRGRHELTDDKGNERGNSRPLFKCVSHPMSALYRGARNTPAAGQKGESGLSAQLTVIPDHCRGSRLSISAWRTTSAVGPAIQSEAAKAINRLTSRAATESAVVPCRPTSADFLVSGATTCAFGCLSAAGGVSA